MSIFERLFRRSSYESYEDVILFYKELGFFAKVESYSLVEKFEKHHGDLPKVDNPWDDVFILAYSVGQSWADDPEADVCDTNRVYTTVLLEWAGISNGVFTPTKIDEIWETEEGPITVSFQIEGAEHIVKPKYLEDWIDLDVLQQINQTIAKRHRQFFYAIDGNFALVLCLSDEQKRRMKRERGFPFAW